MSRGDDKLDNLFKDAYSDNEHAFDPTFWEQTKHVYKAPVEVPFYTKPLFIAGAISVLFASTLWFSVSTPENNILANQQEIQTQISKTENTTFESNNTQNLNQTENRIAPLINNSTNELDQIATEDNSISNKPSNELAATPISTEDLPDTKTGNETSVAQQTNIVKVATNSQFKENQKQPSSNTADGHNSETPLERNQSKAPDSKLANSNNPGSNKAPLVAVGSVITSQNTQLGKSSTGNSKLNQNQPTKTAFKSGAETEVESQLMQEKESTLSQDLRETNSNQNNFSSYRKEEFSLEHIQSNQNSFLKQNEDELSLNSINNKPLKSLNKPFSILLSSGYMWSQNLKTAENRISTSAIDKNIELSVEYHFKPHWGAQIGLSYNETTESQSYNYLNSTDNSFWNYTTRNITIQDRTWWLGGWHYYAPYQDSVIDTVWVQKLDTANAQLNTEHVIKMIEIPFLITYNIAVNRWNIQVASGASLGFNAGSKGSVLIDNDNVREESTSKQLFNSVQYNYLLRTQVAYSLTEHWQLSARPQMKMNLNSIYKSSSSQYQKYLFYGVNAGIIYRF